MRSILLLLPFLLLASAAQASLDPIRDLLLSEIPASWKRAALELEPLAADPAARNLRALMQLYGLGVSREPAVAEARTRALLAEGVANPELLRHVGAALAEGVAGLTPNAREGLRLLDAAAAQGDGEAAALAGALRLGFPQVAPSGREQLAKAPANGHPGGRAWLARAQLLGVGGAVEAPAAATLLAGLGARDTGQALEKVAMQRLQKADEIARAASAIPWLRWAAAAGSHVAAAELGRLYRGLPNPAPGIPPDAPEALRWFRRAALAGDPGVSTNIQQVFLEYPALKRPDAEVATELAAWARDRADHGFPEALAMLATAYETGTRGVPADAAKAEAAYAGLAAAGHPRAAELLDRFRGTRAMVAGAETAGLHPSQIRAAAAGDERARYAVGLAFTRTPPGDASAQAAFSVARGWLEGFCNGGGDPVLATLRAGACTRLADLLRREGGGLDQLGRVRELYRRCADHGSVDCARQVGETYQAIPLWKGAPTEVDEAKERPWIARAAEAGDARAKERWAALNAAPGFFANLGENALWGLLILLGFLGVVGFFMAGDSKKTRSRY